SVTWPVIVAAATSRVTAVGLALGSAAAALLPTPKATAAQSRVSLVIIVGLGRVIASRRLHVGPRWPTVRSKSWLASGRLRVVQGVGLPLSLVLRAKLRICSATVTMEIGLVCQHN